jgi:MSHA biogenesis protein MshN
MSIINRVLRDLEERHGQGPEGQPLVTDIRAVVPRRRRLDPWIIGGVLTGITVAVLLGLAYLRWTAAAPSKVPVKVQSVPDEAVRKPVTELPATNPAPTETAGVPGAPPVTNPAAVAPGATPAVPPAGPSPQPMQSPPATATVTTPNPSSAARLPSAPASAAVAAGSAGQPGSGTDAPPVASMLPKVTDLSKTLAKPVTKPVGKLAKPAAPSADEARKKTAIAAPAEAASAAASATPDAGAVPASTKPVVPAKPATPTPSPQSASAQTPGAQAQGESVVDKRMREMPAESRAEMLFRDGVSALQLGRVNDAQGHFEEALKVLPTHGSARQALIGLLLDLQRYEEAERRLSEGLALDPKNARYAMVLARVQVERGDNVSALHTLQATAPVAGDDANYNGFMATVLQRLGIHDKAVEHYQVALKGGPGNAAWLTGSGISLRELGKVAEAREAFGRAQAVPNLSPELQTFVERQLRELAARKN